jgi:hypothetical protein
MTMTFHIQAPSSSFAIGVEKLVGHPRCEDGGLLTDAMLEGWLVLSLDRAPCQNSKNHWCFSFDSKQRVISSPQPSVVFTILTQWYTQTSTERELARNMTSCFLSLVLWHPLLLGTAVSSLAPPQTCQQKSNDYMNPHITTHYQPALKVHATPVTHYHHSVMCSLSGFMMYDP